MISQILLRVLVNIGLEVVPCHPQANKVMPVLLKQLHNPGIEAKLSKVLSAAGGHRHPSKNTGMPLCIDEKPPFGGGNLLQVRLPALVAAADKQEKENGEAAQKFSHEIRLA